ncbi:MAG: hypothetical protein ACI8S6_001621 [Myxococcota bacterium]|jgi:hypothetical protein
MMALWLLAACGEPNCEGLYAPSLLLVRLDASSWPDGDYTVSLLDADTFDELTCTATLPAGTSECDDEQSTIKIIDGALTQVEAWGFTPDTVTVTVDRDGETLWLGDVDPVYEEDEPAGEECGTRRVGAIDVAW